MVENQIDSCVTDPPYGLSFMGKDWDHGVPGRHFWEEILRVLKPGAHLLAFGGTRTFHRLACAIEDAGFEIRDCIMWVYGSGFPKSLDVGKAIDKSGGINPETMASILRKRREMSGLSREELSEKVGCTTASIRDWEEGRSRAKGLPLEFMVPSQEYRERLAGVLGYTKDERKKSGVSTDRRGDGTVYGIGHSGELMNGGNTDAAKQWQGWGTALKPAWEPIIVARKPLVGTVVTNVLQYGTGAINVDMCRVSPTGEGKLRIEEESQDRRYTEQGVTNFAATPGPRGGSPAGRWPANLIHDGSEEVLELFPYSKDGVATNRNRKSKCVTSGRVYAEGRKHSGKDEGYGGQGSAARFFYCAKASKSDRTESGQVENNHPTVKPTDLMRYLCRLVTPPNGVVLDPFCGSGSTGKAAVQEGFRFLGADDNLAYCEIARCRIVANLG